jgi:hypothetical protein
VYKVLGSGRKKIVEALPGSIVARNDKERIANGGGHQVLHLVDCEFARSRIKKYSEYGNPVAAAPTSNKSLTYAV